MVAVACHLMLWVALVFQGAAPRKTEREQYGFKGNVKFVEIAYEEAPDPANGNPGGMIVGSTLEFDLDGNWIATTYRWANGAVQKDLLDPKGHTINSRTVDAKGVVTSRADTVLDDRGRIISVTMRRGDSQVVLTSTSAYDEKGRLKESITADGEGAVQTKGVYAYDPERHWELRTYYDGAGKLDTKQVSVYDEVGNETRCESRNARGQLTYKRYRTKEDGNVIQTEEFYGPDGVRTRKAACVMDQAGQVMTTINYNLDDSVEAEYKPDYQYDAQGNYIEMAISKITTKNGATSSELRQTIRRKITYY